MPRARIIPKKQLVEREAHDVYKVHTTGDRELLSDQKFMRRFLKFTEDSKIMQITDSKGRFRISRYIGQKSDGKHLQRSYLVEMIDKDNHLRKYFIKEEREGDFSNWGESGRIYDWEDAKTESKALKIISDYLKQSGEQDIELVPLRFALLFKKEKKSIVCYDFQENHHLNTLQAKKQISTTEFLKLNKKLREFEGRVNEYLKRNYTKYGVEPGTILTDISPEFTFYDISTGKLKIFNPVLLK